MTSPFWENREKIAASREKCFLTEDTPQKNGYIISSYEPLANLFFLYFNIGPNHKKNKNKQMLQDFFCKPLTCFIFVFQEAESEEY